MMRCGQNRYHNAKTTEKETCQEANNSHEQIISHKQGKQPTEEPLHRATHWVSSAAGLVPDAEITIYAPMSITNGHHESSTESQSQLLSVRVSIFVYGAAEKRSA